MKYKVTQHVGPDGHLEESVIETNESYGRLMAHAHIHSAEPIAEEPKPKKKTEE